MWAPVINRGASTKGDNTNSNRGGNRNDNNNQSTNGGGNDIQNARNDENGHENGRETVFENNNVFFDSSGSVDGGIPGIIARVIFISDLFPLY